MRTRLGITLIVYGFFLLAVGVLNIPPKVLFWSLVFVGLGGGIYWLGEDK